MGWPLSWEGTLVLGLFALAYILFAFREEKKTLVAGALGSLAIGVSLLGGVIPLGPAGACEIFGYHPPGSPWSICSVSGFVEWDTLGLLVGLFILAAVLSQLDFFRYVAIRLARSSGGRPLPLFLTLSLLSFALSAFINSITVMVVLAALTLELSRELKLDPIPFLLAEISCSNVGGAATFVGDPPNVILGTYFHLTFTEFLVYAGPLALGALGVTVTLFGLRYRSEFRSEKARSVRQQAAVAPPPALDRKRLPLALGAFALTLGLLAFNASLPPSVGEIGLIGGALGLAVAGRSMAWKVLKAVDWEVLLFFLFLFLLVGGLEATGVIRLMASGIAEVGGGNALLTASLLLWSLGLLSSVVDNVPLAAAAAPLILTLHQTRGLPVQSLVYATAVGTDVGGNGTPIGASANVVGLGIARRAGVTISWSRYLKEAFPIMVASLAAANLVLFFYH